MLLALIACAAPDSPNDSGPTVSTSPTEAADDGLPIALAFPLADRTLFSTIIGVDHDPTVQDGSVLGRATCLDYVGRSFPHCYDEHDGSDYILKGGFSTMDEGSTPVIAAAAGTVVLAQDGYYDRCHGDSTTGDVSCDGYEIVANAVTLEHEGSDGSRWRTLYWHLKTDSVAVEVGDRVARGQELGRVGSSGYSTLPHLHFELQLRVGEDQWRTLDPYAGPYSQEQSGWCDQGPDNGLPGDCSAD